jgi:small multidrug resistance family-3 protein
MTRTALIYVGAALAEITGCFGVWLWLREGRSAWILPAALASLAVFAWLLTFAESDAAGRAYAAYGGVYIVASIIWLWQIEGIRPDRWDVIGACICLLGAGLILFGPRSAGVT